LFVLLKIITVLLFYLYLLYSLKKYVFISNGPNNFNRFQNNLNHCNHLYEYSKVEKQPTTEEDGKKTYICKYCRNKYTKKIPKLNNHNYYVEKLFSNCENGNGFRYFSKLHGTYDLTDRDIKLHSLYGSKCSKCHKLIGEFEFKSLGSLKCTGYPRLIRLSSFWNNNWLLGGNFGNKVGCRISKDQGFTWTEPIYISKFPDYICSNIDLFELPNHDILSAFRAIGKFDIPNNNIRYNRKLGCSLSHDGGYTWENLGSIIDNFELAEKLGFTEKQAVQAIKDEKKVGFFEPFIMMVNNEIKLFYADDFTPMINHTISDNPYFNYMVQNIYTQTYNLKKKFG